MTIQHSNVHCKIHIVMFCTYKNVQIELYLSMIIQNLSLMDVGWGHTVSQTAERSESPWTLSTKLTTADVINRNDIIIMRQAVCVGDQFEILMTDFSFWKGGKMTKKVTYIMILPPTSKNRYQYLVCCISMSKVFLSPCV